MPLPSILGLPWPSAKMILDLEESPYYVQETFPPSGDPKSDGGIQGIVVRVREDSQLGLEITLAYPIIAPQER